jgi:hypothetical protein
MYRWGWVWLFAISVYAQPQLRVDTVRSSSGSELLTVFEEFPEGADLVDGRREMPLLAVRDNRQVWVFTYEPPSWAQRAAAGVPFFYRRSGLAGGSGSKPPKPVVDLSRPARGIWKNVGYALLQARLFDPLGIVSRLTTRSYGANVGSERKVHILEADALIAETPVDGATELEKVSARLELSGRMLGGLVSEDTLPRYRERTLAERAENRAHNWELLRQAAEENGLCFRPLPLSEMPGAFAMVSVAAEDLIEGAPKRFGNQFLHISNPFTDENLRGRTGEIPLAVYALDYPRVPLRLVDFRRSAGPQLNEMGLRFADDLTSDVLGFTGLGLGNLDYMALKQSWMFVHTRHGGATNRGAREQAFVQLRHALGADAGLDPDLRRELMLRLERLDIDPAARTWAQEVRGAWRQYEALVK